MLVFNLYHLNIPEFLTLSVNSVTQTKVSNEETLYILYASTKVYFTILGTREIIRVKENIFNSGYFGLCWLQSKTVTR